MRSFPTLRDAEIAYGQLEDRLNKLEKKSGGALSIDSSSAKAPQITNVTNIQEAIDSTLNADGTLVLHRLIHQFLEKLIAKELSTESIGFEPTKWTIKTGPNNKLSFAYDDGVETFLLTFLANAAYPNWFVEFNGTLGKTASRVSQIATSNFSVLPGGTASVAGQVLTATDTLGNG